MQVGAYDRVAFTSGQCVFTLDTATQTLLLHSFNVAPVGGGNVTGQGQLWTSPEAELDDRAVRIELHGRDLPVEAILHRYENAADVEVPKTLLGAFLRGKRLV